MIFQGKYKVLSSYIASCDYEYVILRIKKSLRANKKLLISPVASQSLVLGATDSELGTILSKFDLLVPDGQWVRIALNFLYNQNLKNRVYGPELMMRVCKFSQKNKYSIFLYGTTAETLKKLQKNIVKKYPQIHISATLPSSYSVLTYLEKLEIAKKIKRTKSRIIFIGVGSPLQERLAYDLSLLMQSLDWSVIIIPVGAAFDFISGNKPQAPIFFQDHAMEGAWRFFHEPGRLWIRYLIFGPFFILLVLWQKVYINFRFALQRSPES